MLNPLLSIAEVKQEALKARFLARVHAQLEGKSAKQTRDLKPYYELQLRDATGGMMLRVWSDHPQYSTCEQLRPGGFLGIEGEYSISGQYGLEVRNWTFSFLGEEESSALMAGPETLRQKQERDFQVIRSEIAGISDPRLKRLGEMFLLEFGERLKRSAGARNYHHSRRGGLVEHIAQMLRAANAIAAVYPELNRDLLLAGVLFHDSGKLWENCYSKETFSMPYDLRGELLGHISIGVELVNRFWARLREAPEYQSWKELQPESELVHLHLLHLVASHHGEKGFGSPVEPKTPEAMTLHLIDNLDAKLEMIFSAYLHGQRLTPEIIERIRPLATNVVINLPKLKNPE